jgi:hypothetical protein
VCVHGDEMHVDDSSFCLPNRTPKQSTTCMQKWSFNLFDIVVVFVSAHHATWLAGAFFILSRPNWLLLLSVFTCLACGRFSSCRGSF